LCLAVALTLWAFKLRTEANRLRTIAVNETEKTKDALVASNHEQGKGLLVMAKGRLDQQDLGNGQLGAENPLERSRG
jgi:hypothetical protein